MVSRSSAIRSYGIVVSSEGGTSNIFTSVPNFNGGYPPLLNVDWERFAGGYGREATDITKATGTEEDTYTMPDAFEDMFEGFLENPSNTNPIDTWVSYPPIT